MVCVAAKIIFKKKIYLIFMLNHEEESCKKLFIGCAKKKKKYDYLTALDNTQFYVII